MTHSERGPSGRRGEDYLRGLIGRRICVAGRWIDNPAEDSARRAITCSPDGWTRWTQSASSTTCVLRGRRHGRDGARAVAAAYAELALDRFGGRQGPYERVFLGPPDAFRATFFDRYVADRDDSDLIAGLLT